VGGCAKERYVHYASAWAYVHPKLRTACTDRT